MWVYVFGSLVRGEFESDSDIDILTIGTEEELTSLPSFCLKYTKRSIEECFQRGDLFAHHLFAESKLVFSSDGSDILGKLGYPHSYSTFKEDARQFLNIAHHSLCELQQQCYTTVYEMGLLYMCMRDLAMIATYLDGRVSFSKYSPYKTALSLELPLEKYRLLKKSRVASTRGKTLMNNLCLTNEDYKIILDWLNYIEKFIYDKF